MRQSAGTPARLAWTLSSSSDFSARVRSSLWRFRRSSLPQACSHSAPLARGLRPRSSAEARRRPLPAVSGGELPELGPQLLEGRPWRGPGRRGPSRSASCDLGARDCPARRTTPLPFTVAAPGDPGEAPSRGTTGGSVSSPAAGSSLTAASQQGHRSAAALRWRSWASPVLSHDWRRDRAQKTDRATPARRAEGRLIPSPSDWPAPHARSLKRRWRPSPRGSATKAGQGSVRDSPIRTTREPAWDTPCILVAGWGAMDREKLYPPAAPWHREGCLRRPLPGGLPAPLSLPRRSGGAALQGAHREGHRRHRPHADGERRPERGSRWTSTSSTSRSSFPARAASASTSPASAASTTSCCA